MKNLAMVLFLFPTIFTGTWEEFISYEGRFRVLAPAALTLKVDSVETTIGKMAYHTFFYQNTAKEADNLFYMVSYCDYPPGTFEADSAVFIGEFFEQSIQAAVESVKGKLMYSSDFQLQKYPGKLWRIDYLDGKAVIKTRAFIAGNRYYSIQTVSYQSKSINHDSEKFLESFRIL